MNQEQALIQIKQQVFTPAPHSQNLLPHKTVG
jgi:hypothetical protein